MIERSQWYMCEEIPDEMWSVRERGWLTSAGSLTRHLRRVTDGNIEHRIFQEAWDNPAAEECRALNMNACAMAQVREIDWWHCGKLWVVARVIIPEQTLERKKNALASVGRRSLGDILFSQPQWERGHFEFAQLDRSHPFCHRVQKNLPSDAVFTWARRSLFCLDGSELLITELFTPDLLNVRLPPDD